MIVDDFQNKRVLVVGDVMLDQFVRGGINRISPEAPAMVLNIKSQSWVVGGAGNVAVNIADLGGVAELIGLVGNDAAADRLDGLCDAWPNLNTDFVKDAGWVTIQKTRYIASDRHILRTDMEQKHVPHGVAEQLSERIRASAPNCDAMVISDYSKGVVSDLVIKTMVELSRLHNIPLIADPKRRGFQDYRGCSILTPNRKELSDATALDANTDDEIARAIPIAMDQFDGPIMLTRSEQGVSLFEPNGTVFHDPAQCKMPRDVSGAGDTVAAALALAMSTDADLETCMKVANAAAGVVVSKSGTASLTPQELVDAMLRDPGEAGDRQSKLSTHTSAREVTAAWQMEGLRVGFTNGCFDIVHPGHVKLLREARSRCDKLIVGLNTDSSVSRLKGPERPIQSEGARADVMAALESVDLVTLFDDDTPLELIKAVRPDIIFKGADYTVDQVVGGDFVQSYGGSVELIDLAPGQSTTRLIERSQKEEA
ncbi:MAG: D-glycero-beta-D-manno-heptose 1-phosphate adenylyltransferase [Pseudomonadota bacterium]